MPKEIVRGDVQRLISEGAQVLEVLELSQFREAHLPSAIQIHLRKLKQQALSKLDRSRPVVVYCWDSA